MKNPAAFIVIGALAIVLIGCGGEKRQEQTLPMSDTLRQGTSVPEQIDTTTKVQPPPTEETKRVETRPNSPEIVTLRGQVVDLVGFLSGTKQTIEDIRNSAGSGNPLGFFDSDKNKVYVIGLAQVGESPKDLVLPYVGLKVFVKGKTYSLAGVNVILVSDIGKAI